MTKSKNLGLNLPSRDNTTDLADINVVSENFEIVDNEFENVYNKLNNTGVVNTVSGNPIVLKDSAKAPLQNLKLFGKTEQNGTPTPEAPIPLVSVGDSGSFEIGVCGKNIANLGCTTGSTDYASLLYLKNFKCFVPKDTPITISVDVEATSNTKVYWNTNGNFLPSFSFIDIKAGKTRISYKFTTTDDMYYDISNNALLSKTATGDGVAITTSNAQLEFNNVATPYEPCNKQTLTMPYTLRSTNGVDEVDFNRGIYVQKNYSIYLDSMDNISVGMQSGYTRFAVSGTPKALSTGQGRCNRLNVRSYPIGNNGEDNAITAYTGGGVYFRCDALANATDKETWISEHPIHFIYQLATPIETPLSESEINAYKKLHTNKPTTTILSEADMEVSYVADTKLYIDNKIAELTALTLEV